MRIKVLRNVGRELMSLVPVTDRDGLTVARGLVGANLVEGEVRDMDPREAQLLKDLGLAEDAPAEMGNPTAPAELARRFGQTKETA